MQNSNPSTMTGSTLFASRLFANRSFANIRALIVTGMVVLSANVQALFLGDGEYEDQLTNQLLSYHVNQQEDGSIIYQAKDGSYKLRILYGRRIDVENLIVELDGVDISHLFNPEEMQMEDVDLPLTKQLHILKLRVPTDPEFRVSTTWDYDTLTFVKRKPEEPSTRVDIRPVDWERLIRDSEPKRPKQP